MNRHARHHNAGKGTGEASQTALIIAAHGRHYVVELGDGSRLHAFPRGKKSDCAVGDHVAVEMAAADQCVITAVSPRKNLLHRSDQFKSKLLAANIDQVVIVLATEREFFRGSARPRAGVGRRRWRFVPSSSSTRPT